MLACFAMVYILQLMHTSSSDCQVKYVSQPNKLTSVMSLEGWNLAGLMVEGMVSIMLLDLWRYPYFKQLRYRRHSSLGQNNLEECTILTFGSTMILIFPNAADFQYTGTITFGQTQLLPIAYISCQVPVRCLSSVTVKMEVHLDSSRCRWVG